jgi:tetratricopeptide (TPR) repeat protein
MSAKFAANETIILNNRGVELVSKGEYDNAIPLFSRSLQIIRPFLTEKIEISFDQQPEGQPSSVVDMPSSEQLDSSIFSSSQAPAMEERRRKRARKSMSNENSDRASVSKEHDPDQAFVFKDPIEIPEIAYRSKPSKRLFAKLTMVAMFNLGLAFHLSALRHSSFPKLIQAKELYELAFQMHLQQSCDVTLLYSLALMNNLGLIYHVLGDHSRSGNCFSHMLSTMMFLLESQDAHTIKQWDGLLSNVMGLIFPEPPKAAAA